MTPQCGMVTKFIPVERDKEDDGWLWYHDRFQPPISIRTSNARSLLITSSLLTPISHFRLTTGKVRTRTRA